MADVASALRSWSVTAGSNLPANTTVTGAGVAPNFQQIQATVRQYEAHIGSSVVCAATTDLSTVDGKIIPLSGSATVTSFGTEAEGISYVLQFSGSPLLKNSTAIQTPTATSGDLSIVSGDIIEVVSQGSGNWKVANAYQPNPRFATISANSLNVSAISGVNTLNASAISGVATLSASAISGVATMNGSALTGTTVTATSEIFLGSASVASGIGIAFPSNQSASSDVNTLDDYEEGTWTPSLGGTTTYTSQTGSYTKIGRLVYVRGHLQINAIGSGNTVTVSGLPFTSAGGSTSYPIAVSGAVSLATAVVSLTAFVVSNQIDIQSRTAASVSESSSNAIFGNSTVLDFAGHFEV